MGRNMPYTAMLERISSVGYYRAAVLFNIPLSVVSIVLSFGALGLRSTDADMAPELYLSEHQQVPTAMRDPPLAGEPCIHG